jgi:peptidoglycan/xylan/chitin deacetylase (PgdA/CDA1 family)
MPPLVRASIVCHGAALGLLLVSLSWWPGALALLAVDHLLLCTAGLWPRSRLLGPNLTRLPAGAAAHGAVALTIDDGPDPEVTPAVLQLLRAAGAHATFFCIGHRAAAHPELVREIVRQGHSVQNHSQRHSHVFSLLGRRAIEREIGAAQSTLASISGRRPECFRAPAGLRNPCLDPVLHRLGLRLVSWTRRGYDTRERDPARVLQRLTEGLAAGDILLLHDGHAARTPGGRAVVLEVLPALLQRIHAAGLHTVTLPEGLAPGQGSRARAGQRPPTACGAAR